jgi:hypothetical protein
MSLLIDRLKSSFNEPEYSDIVFELSDGRKLYSHKFIISSQRFPFSFLTFKSKIFHNMCSEKNTFKIEKAHPDAFFQCLKFLYTGDIIIDFQNVSHILQCAELFGLNSIVTLCKEFEVKKEISIVEYGENVEFNDKSSHGASYLLGYLTTIPKDCTLTHFGVICHTCPGLAQFAVYDTNANLVVYTKAIQLTKGKNLIPFVSKGKVKKGDYRLMGSYDSSSSIGQQTSTNPIEYFSFTPTTTSVPPPSYSSPQKYNGNKFNYFVVTQSLPPLNLLESI